jgi:molybdate transport system substrate-binding protein
MMGMPRPRPLSPLLGRRAALAPGVVAATALLAAPLPAQERDVLVFAAASLRNALDEAAAQYKAETGKTVVASYAASSALARQIEAAAPADIFISADEEWMDHLAARGLIRPDTRSDLLGNRLVLIAPADSDATLEIAPAFPLADLLGDGRLAMGDPQAVPARRYGRAALESLGVWSSVEAMLAPAENVRAARSSESRSTARCCRARGSS